MTVNDAAVAEKFNAQMRTQGFIPTQVFFEETAFVLGWEISNDQFNVVYRPEGDTLLICSLESRKARSGLQTVLLSVLRLWQETAAYVPELVKLRAMIRQSGSENARQVRQKMVSFLQQKGANVMQVDDEQWLELSR